ncbi:MAG: DctP family TRAP transporter solute-binding subunit [Gammaproteobacteria bacterium]|nr:DctP family TRAP transporter solute-binding subunit [Gammaproteobacteria bacterium]
MSTIVNYRHLFNVIVLVFSTLLYSGCSEEGEISSHREASGARIDLRLGHDLPVDSHLHRGAVKFAELVFQKSNGVINVEIFPQETLANDHEMIEMLRKGELDLAIPPTAKLSTLVPSLQIIDFPYLFESHEQAHKILDGPAGTTLLNQLDIHGLKGISFWESGFKQLTTSTPLENADDLKNRKFRIMRSSLLRDQYIMWGAKPLVVDFNKTREALEKGIVDGQENPLSTIWGMKFHTAQSNLILSDHGYLSQVLIVSSSVYQRLPENLQRVLIESGREAGVYQRKESRSENNVLKTKLADAGISVVTLSDKERQILKSRAQTLLEKFRHQFGTRIVEQFIQEIEDDKQGTPGELILGLDADMAGNSALSGLAIRRGIELALDEINGQGGVLGKKLVLRARDNSMVSARGMQNLEHFSREPNLVAVFCGISSPVALSQLDFVHQNKILFLNPWAAATGIVENGKKPNYVFRVSVRDKDAATFLIPKALKESKNVALLLANNGWGRSNYKGMTTELERKGIKATAVEWFDWGEMKRAAIVERIEKSGSRVVVFVGNTVEGAEFVKQFSKLSAPPVIISHWGITGGEFPRLAGESLEKVDLRVLQTYSFINNKNSRARELVSKYKKKYYVENEADIVAPTGTAHAYDLTLMLAKAIKKANSSDMSKIRQAMESLGRFDGLVRTYDPAFSKTDHDALKVDDFFLAKYSSGNLVPLDSVEK